MGPAPGKVTLVDDGPHLGGLFGRGGRAAVLHGGVGLQSRPSRSSTETEQALKLELSTAGTLAPKHITETY